MTSSTSMSSMNKNTVFLAVTLLCCLSAAFGQNVSQSTSGPNSPNVTGNGNSVQVTKEQEDAADEAKADAIAEGIDLGIKAVRDTPHALAPAYIGRLSQLRQEAAELAAQIEDFQREAAQLQKRGQRLQGRLVAAERDALEHAGLDPDKYALDDSFKPVKRQAQPQAQVQRGPGRANKPEPAKAPEATSEPKK